MLATLATAAQSPNRRRAQVARVAVRHRPANGVAHLSGGDRHPQSVTLDNWDPQRDQLAVRSRQDRRSRAVQIATDADDALRRRGAPSNELSDATARAPSLPTGRVGATPVSEQLPPLLRLYQLLSAAATPLAPTLLSHRLKRGKEHPARLDERYGASRIARPDGPLVWVHGASVGELLAVIPLIERIHNKEFAVLCTSGTVSSAQVAEQRLPKAVIHQFVPFDAPRFVERFFDHWRPDLALFVESDLWPNLIINAKLRGIPLILVNGRLSERSFNRWRTVPSTIAALLRRFDLCLAQSAGHAALPRPRRAAHHHHRQPQA